jgi:hypothetical protein
MDSRQTILPDALRDNANLFRTDWCQNAVSMDGFELAILGTGYPLPGGYDVLVYYSDKIELVVRFIKRLSFRPSEEIYAVISRTRYLVFFRCDKK